MTDDRLLDAGEVAAMLNLPERWVRSATRDGRLPHIRLGRYRRYRRDTIRPNYWLRLPTYCVIDPRLSEVDAAVLGITNSIRNRDPARDSLARGLRVHPDTITTSVRHLAQLELVRVVHRKGRSNVLHLADLVTAAPHGRQRYASIPPVLWHAVVSDIPGRRGLRALRVLQRLLRRQQRFHGANVSPDVIAADLNVEPALVRLLLETLEERDLIVRHRDHPLDDDELHVYSVPLAAPPYPIDLRKLAANQAQHLEQLDLPDRTCRLIGTTIDFHQFDALRIEIDRNTTDAAITAAADTNLTRSTLLVVDLNEILRTLKNQTEVRSGTNRGPVTANPRSGQGQTEATSLKLEVKVEENHGLTAVGGEEERTDEHRDQADAREGAKSKEREERDVLELLPKAAAAIEDAFNDIYVPGPLQDDLHGALWVFEHAHNAEEPLSRAQRETLDSFIAKQVRGLPELPDAQREKFPIVRAAVQRATGDDELIDAVKASQRSQPIAPEVLALLGGGSLYHQPDY